MNNRDSAPSGATVPLDEAVWQAWLVKNRDQERLDAARGFRVVLVLPPFLLAFALAWYFGRW